MGLLIGGNEKERGYKSPCPPNKIMIHLNLTKGMKYFLYIVIAAAIFYAGYSINDKSDKIESLELRQKQLKSKADSLERIYQLRGDTLELIILHYRNVSESRSQLIDKNKVLLKQLYEAKKPTYYTDSAIDAQIKNLYPNFELVN